MLASQQIKKPPPLIWVFEWRNRRTDVCILPSGPLKYMKVGRARLMWLMSRMGWLKQSAILAGQSLLQRRLSARSSLETGKGWWKGRLTWWEFYGCCICVKTTECIFSVPNGHQKETWQYLNSQTNMVIQRLCVFKRGQTLIPHRPRKKNPCSVEFPQPEERHTLKANRREEPCH